MASVFDQSLVQAAAAADHIHKVVYDSVLQTQNHIQIAQSDIRIHNNCLSVKHGKTCTDIGRGSRLAHAAFAGCYYNNFTHIFISS